MTHTYIASLVTRKKSVPKCFFTIGRDEILPHNFETKGQTNPINLDLVFQKVSTLNRRKRKVEIEPMNCLEVIY